MVVSVGIARELTQVSDLATRQCYPLSVQK